MKLVNYLPVAALVLLPCFAIVDARAQSVYWNAAGARSAGLGGIALPSSDDVLGAMAGNPAGLTYLQHPVAGVGGLAAFSRGSFSNVANTNTPMSATPSAGAFGAFATPLRGRRIFLGVAETPLVTAKSDWTYMDARGTAGASYGVQRNRSEILVERSTAALAISVNRRVSLGLTAGADYNRNLLHGVYVFQTQPVVKGLKTLLDLHTSGVGVNGGAGMVVEATSRLSVGVAWKSKSEIQSHGTATGNLGAQLAAAGLAARPDFAYNAAVHNTVPQSMLLTLHERVGNRWSLAAEGEWIAWKSAFRTLNVALTNGNNADVNGLLGSSSLNDSVPLFWKNQFPVRLGVERTLSETVTARAAFAHTNDSVPNSTVMPLTAAIFKDEITAGAGWHKGRAVIDGAYGFVPSHTAAVGTSLLQAGEYSNSRIRAGLQTVTLSAGYVF